MMKGHEEKERLAVVDRGPDELVGLCGVEAGEGGEVGGLGHDLLVAVERAGDQVRPAGVVAGVVGTVAPGAGAHVVGVGQAEVAGEPVSGGLATLNDIASDSSDLGQLEERN